MAVARGVQGGGALAPPSATRSLEKNRRRQNFVEAPKQSIGCDASGLRARSRSRGGGDLARLRRQLVLESVYIHHREAPPIDVYQERRFAYSNWLGIKILEQFVYKRLTSDYMFFLYLHLKIFV